jgi:hypothetical protein
MTRSLRRIRDSVRSGRYRLTGHAHDEMAEDDLSSADIEAAILAGRLARRLRGDPRGHRYEVVGPATDGRPVGVVCRFLPSGTMLIITAYAIAE